MNSIRVNIDFMPEPLQESVVKMTELAVKQLDFIKRKKCVGSKNLGWFDYPSRNAKKILDDVGQYVASIKGTYDTVVVVGIGGSYLGTRALAEAIQHDYVNCGIKTKHVPMVYIGNHLAASGIADLLDYLEARKPIVNVISKSGTTTEPSVAFRVLRNFLEKKFGVKESAKRIVATTDPTGGALRETAKETGYRTFDVPSDMGGRYSVLSPVGILPLALAGFDVSALMKGADHVFSELREELVADDLRNHPAMVYAAARNVLHAQNLNIEALVYSEPKIHYFGEWWKQLFGESEGKNGKGIFPATFTYTTDLHSMGQYLQEGKRQIFETFLLFDRRPDAPKWRVPNLPAGTDVDDGLAYLGGRMIDEVNVAALLATKIAHSDGQVPCIEIRCPTINEQCMGQLFAFFQSACAVSGLMLGVNPFDQPGVELYKKNLFGLLGKPGFEDLGEALRLRIRKQE